MNHTRILLTLGLLFAHGCSTAIEDKARRQHEAELKELSDEIQKKFDDVSQKLDEAERSHRAASATAVIQESPWGRYWQFVPSQPTNILVIVHGSMAEDESAEELAKRFIDRWVGFARRERCLVISPAFDRQNYQAAYGGYRGLFGRQIGADEFVLRIVDQCRKYVQDFDGRFLLYGHSAGGQFAARFAVKHPDRLKGVVLSAPGIYPFPTPLAAWPNGMGTLDRTLHWSESESQHVHYEPDPGSWVSAACLPLAVVVGAEDTIEQPLRAGQRGRHRVDFARNWVADMKKLAEQEGETPQIELIVVPSVGHSSSGLTGKCQEVLSRTR